MLEAGAIANPKGTTGGITFFGQFIDHDLTLDTLPQPDAPVDPTTLVNGRTFAFDLDSVYGGGPTEEPAAVRRRQVQLGAPPTVCRRTCRATPTGQAILVEPRNDENLIIAQIHLSFLRLHNSLIDQGMSFDEAHDTVVDAYRYVVLNDYLPQIVGQDAVDAALKQPVTRGSTIRGRALRSPRWSSPWRRSGSATPRSATRTTSTMRQAACQCSSLDGTADLTVAVSYRPTDHRLRQLLQRAATGRWAVADRPGDRHEDLAVVVPVADPRRGRRRGQRARASAICCAPSSTTCLPVRMSPRRWVSTPHRPGDGRGVPPLFPEGTPLWFYILREAEMTSGGAELGPVGGGIVAEVFVDLLRQDNQKTIYQTEVNLPDVSGGDFRIGDLLVAADQPQEEEPQPPAEQPCRGGGFRPIVDPAQEGPSRHRLHQQLHRADDSARERSGRHRLHQQLHEADDPAPGRHRLFEQLHGVRV